MFVCDRCAGARVRARGASLRQTPRVATLQSAAAEKLDSGTHGTGEMFYMNQ